MYVVGITGGIGSGKSVVSTLFAGLGIEVIDADIVARKVVEPGSAALKSITQRYGEDLLLSNGALDRKQLRAKVFGEEAELRWLENLLHPLIRADIQEQIAKVRSPYTLLVSPLLLETDQKELVDRVLVVDAPEEIQLQRAMARDGASKAQIESIMEFQTGREARAKKADDIILNDKDIDSLKTDVERLHKRYLEAAKH